MADLLNTRWLEMMEKMQTESTQGGEKKMFLIVRFEPEVFAFGVTP
jgi:hypothetical protein